MKRRAFIKALAAPAIIALPLPVIAAASRPDVLSAHNWSFYLSDLIGRPEVYVMSAYRRRNGVWEHVSSIVPAKQARASSITFLPHSPWQSVTQIGQPMPGRMLHGWEGEEPTVTQITVGPMHTPSSYIPTTSAKLTFTRASKILIEGANGVVQWR